MINSAPAMMPHVKAGKLRALAVTSAEASLLVPGLPTVAATGLPGYESVSMTCILAPAKTPAAVINRLNQEIVRALNQPDIKSRFLSAGAETVGSSPEELAATIKADLARMDKIIKDAGIKGE
jgi:tripartite-type tricarboxylate transporter receptor subunit TctC